MKKFLLAATLMLSACGSESTGPNTRHNINRNGTLITGGGAKDTIPVNSTNNTVPCNGGLVVGGNYTETDTIHSSVPCNEEN